MSKTEKQFDDILEKTNQEIKKLEKERERIKKDAEFDLKEYSRTVSSLLGDKISGALRQVREGEESLGVVARGWGDGGAAPCPPARSTAL